MLKQKYIYEIYKLKYIKIQLLLLLTNLKIRGALEIKVMIME